MNNESDPYCLPDKRELSTAECRLLKRLADDSIEIAGHIDQLRAVARCGCGKCPTILLGGSLDDDPITSLNSSRVGEWVGRAENGALVGISLFVSEGRPTELEAWSIEGEEIDGWPQIETIEYQPSKP